MVVMSGTATVLQQFVSGLKSRNEDTRAKSAKDLQHYVTTELRELSQDEATTFYDELNHHIFELVSSSDVNEKKGGILAIVSLIGVEGGNATRISRFANYLRNLLPSSDPVVMEMASKAMGHLSMAGDTFTAEYVEFEVKRALEWLGADRNEGRRHAAVLVLRELAVSAPTFFFQQVQPFFDNIFYAVWDPKQAIREGAVSALRACLILTTQRETKEMQKPQWYKQTFEEAEKGFDETLVKEKGMNREDRVHGALLILNELVRISSMEGERMREEMEEITQQQLVHDKYCKEMMGFGTKPRHITPFTSFQSVQPQQTNALLGLLGYSSPQGFLSFGATPTVAKNSLVESRYCRELMEERFDQVCRWVLKYRTTKNPLIQMTILNLLPRLAAFKPISFTDQYLADTMGYLLACLKKEKERTAAFQALGLLVVAVRVEIQPYLSRVLEIIKAALPPKDFAHKRQKTMQVDATVFTCISMLSRALGPSIQPDIKELLEPMLAVGLSPALTAVLYDLSRQIPQLKKDIQDGLLKMLSLVLMHKPLRHPGMPKGLAHQLASPSLTNIPEASDVGSITLALRTLGSFEFEGHSLTQFVRHCADHFLNSEHKEVRMEAARTCSRLLSPSVHLISGHVVSQTAVQVVADVLSKLLVVGITDPDPDIRYCVLASLDERFDAHLAQAENLQALFVALNDEVFEIRELAICTIGRLSSMNPAFVMPFLRKMLIQILTELEHSGVGRNKEQSARMLGHLVSNAPRLIRPYMEPILKALILKLKDPDPNPGVVISVLATIGELAQVSGLEMRKWMDELFPIIMDMLQDSSSLAKRQVALWTLGQQVASTGYVVEPYRKYPSLLEVLLNFLKTEQNQGIRREAIRVLGLLGALDPYKHKVNIGMIDQSRDASAVSLSESKTSQDSADYSTSEMLVNMGNLPLDEFYPAVAMVTLMRILRDPSLSNHHTMVVQAVTFIFKSLGLKCVQFLPQVMPTFLNVIRVCDASIREVGGATGGWKVLYRQPGVSGVSRYKPFDIVFVWLRFYLCFCVFSQCIVLLCVCVCVCVCVRAQGYTLAEEEENPLVFQHRHLRGNQGDTLASGPVEPGPMKKLHVSTTALQKAWGAARKVSKDDWLEWLRRLSVVLLKESSSPALRSCWSLAQTYIPLARDLFNAAFLSCWSELSEDQQDELIRSIELALTSQDIAEVTQTLLNLAEFMEHSDKGPLPLRDDNGIVLLGERAAKCRAYAKALHYKELEFQKGPSPLILEALISINNKLQQPEAASGVLDYAMKHFGELEIQATWYEKLHEWEDALLAYGKKIELAKEEPDLILGRMRCLEALGEWGQLHQQCCEEWTLVSEETQAKMARMAAAAAWGLGHWDSMEEYTCMIPRDTHDGAFYRAVLALHQDLFSLAQQCIDKARDLLDAELTAMAGESYSRAYGVSSARQTPTHRPLILSVAGLMGGGYASPVEVMDAGRVGPHALLWTARHQVLHLGWGSKNQLRVAYRKCSSHRVWMSPSRCFLKLGEWQLSLQGINESTIPKVLQYYSHSTEHDRNWYKAWHAWAVMNFEAVLHYKHQSAGRDDKKKVRHASGASEASNSDSEAEGGEHSPAPSPSQRKVGEDLSKTLLLYTVPAVQGFFRSISLSRGNNLQDTLRVLTLWFDYGHWPDVNEALVEGIKTIQIDTWLQVIPQLIARIDTPRALVGRLIHQLLTDIGRYHPQALIYPLTVASKSTTTARHNAANKILKNMCEHCNTLVQQAIMVSEELIRVAILWHEMWHEGLEEASRLYFGERNVKGMFAVLEPLHAMMERGPQTLKETSFNQAYGRDLMEAQDWCRKYMRSGNVKDLTQAWDLYYHVFRRISKQLPQLTSLELQYVSPKLLMCRDLELAVPGTYDPNQPIVRIQSIAASLQVITSKQRPRKLTIMGSNGCEFMFLLKGHEDLRQDERVMQLFGLVNTLLANDPASLRKNLSIQRYAVIPLSTNSGLIGWVPHCDTLHALIRDYREKKKILLNIEHRIMLRMAPDYDHLTLMEKVEVFEHAVNNTAGDDLAKLLWLKSPSSEVWFDRRTNYTRSLAVMSMVGYILGLGDRHPSNLMLDRLSGKILHIDFGDCFEVAMTREKFPEKIPFRLTRMLTNAMEVTGLDGNYRITCHTVMQVLREHRDSVMAVLEAFVYDPLLNWRLMDTNTKGNKRSRTRTDSYTAGQSVEALEGIDLGETTHKKAGTTVPESIHSFIGDGLVQPEALNKKAIQIINRVRDKLTGRDFSHDETLDVPTQVELLIKQATSHENLCQCYIGWCPFW
ncbi:serine/threonine-protein kinase mTOR [Gadus macrocephalus]|uniref:serine/threonine-protein kinase mTOR n=1 Tax=Gadus macrocephalus TaxID=80720 RepID=UPI0028CB17BB|nr:serine/threonine-protein kinase mTOR [Gadus macrocephalus]